ncbi:MULTISPECIES: hypothetical protein [Roseobacteraceae]|uniref:hypothetical protein n=1 Tax=Roseobacteraceae TaxID=2854170 RepID=UPI0012FC652B|nr:MULTISPECIES: hypothetical protein [Roseobacteraceae]MCA0996931.1 hypothetical protein [Alloyangia pacifica]NDW00892.1 hypothetical protein [Salipiger sp. PrR002]NDW57987.1 hypothetical protein [Salipiger sp. PrR004]
MHLFLVGLLIGFLIMSPVIALVLFVGIMSRRKEAGTPPRGGLRAPVRGGGFPAGLAKP